MASVIESTLSAGKYIDTQAVSRPHAVAAALEIIAGLAASGGSGVNLGYEFEQLSSYADKIQEALRVK
ncbi:hypothetical protein AAHB44_17695 [Pseudomonas simiae]